MDGRTTRLCDMEESHLINTAALVLRWISKSKGVPIHQIGKNYDIPAFHTAMFLELERRDLTAKFLMHIGDVRALVNHVKEQNK